MGAIRPWELLSCLLGVIGAVTVLARFAMRR
jgi:hypothetical protein